MNQSSVLYIVTVVCFTIILLSVVGAYNYYVTQDRILMSKNIDDAISKGIDPLSVRCAYASEIDAVCVSYAYSRNTNSKAKK
jgi:hypothetical protein|tara:strand:- start:2894 stop:3139 length:246 start_codon:yes stop_codon:yes gene_type:complete